MFPGWANQPLYISGKSYMGTYIVCQSVHHYLTILTCLQPYILKVYFEETNPPVKIAKIAIGDHTIPALVSFTRRIHLLCDEFYVSME